MQTVGYCGADLKSLCAESALVALRSKYPQIYSSRQKLLIDVNSLVVSCCTKTRKLEDSAGISLMNSFFVWCCYMYFSLVNVSNW